MDYVQWRFEKRMDHNLNQLKHSVSRYLVESRGKLLMVLREYFAKHGVARHTSTFRIFEIQLETSLHGDVIAALGWRYRSCLDRQFSLAEAAQGSLRYLSSLDCRKAVSITWMILALIYRQL
ncbi:hypothetical protein ACP4OV_024841 [Aristida adscensionis]